MQYPLVCLRRGEEAEAQQEELTQIAERLQEQLDEAHQELEEAKAGEAECQKAELAIEAESQEAARKISAIQQALADANGKKQSAASRLRMLREMERDYAGYQQAVKQVLLHAKGSEGVKGVVASLM